MTSRPSAPLIAVVGCDGSGKSTLTKALHAWLAEFQPTVVCHLGKQSGNIGRALERLPFLGPKLVRSIDKKTKKARTTEGPSLATALGIYAFTVRRVRRFRRMMRLRRAGLAIIADRFPQTEMPGAIDGIGLGNARPTGLIGWLARSEQRQFDAMTATDPDLVIRLNVSLGIAAQRKPDHNPSSLAHKIADLSHLTFQGAPIVELDADEPFAIVEEKAKIEIARLLETKYGMTVLSSRTQR